MHTHHIIDMTDRIVARLPQIIEKPDNAQALIQSLLAEFWTDKVADVWHTKDVIDFAAKEGYIIDEDQANSILHDFFAGFDANDGLSWNTLDYYWEQFLEENPDIDRIEGLESEDDNADPNLVDHNQVLP